MAARIDTVRRLFDELQVDVRDRDRIFAGTACAWLGMAA
jgi:hypothetical protein